MNLEDSVTIARLMIKRYGLQAQAIAAENAALAESQDAASQKYWDQIHVAIRELRQSSSGRQRPH